MKEVSCFRIVRCACSNARVDHSSTFKVINLYKSSNELGHCTSAARTDQADDTEKTIGSVSGN